MYLGIYPGASYPILPPNNFCVTQKNLNINIALPTETKILYL